MTVALGLELNADLDMVAIAIAGADGGRWSVNLAYYGMSAGALAEISRLTSTPDHCGVFLDPMPSAGLLDDLRAVGVWLHELGPEDVSGAAFQFTEQVRAHRVRLPDHPALREAVRAAQPRASARWGFERRKVVADVGPLNAVSFALLGLRRNEAADSPGVWLV